MSLCGNGVIDPGEQCEGTDFGGKTCTTFGFGGGTLLCNQFCSIVLSSCTPAENCTNQQDDDNDGFTDCDDSDCATNAACLDSCVGATSAILPAFEFGNLTGRPNTITSSCMPQAGREIVYAVTPSVDGDLSVQITFTSFDAGFSVRTACADPASEILCVNKSGSGANEVGSFPATAGQTYYVVVEAVDNQPGFYDLQFDQVTPESSCSDYTDNDFDGYLDCDDPTTCKGTAACVGGATTPGQPCFSNTDCASVNGDPICLPSFMGWTNGYCSEFCNLAADDCPMGAECVQLGFSTDGTCMKTCTTTAQCAAGYSCVDRGLAQKVCDRPPEVNCNNYADDDSDGLTDCEDPTSCQSLAACVPGAGVAGQPCAVNTDCFATPNDPFCIDQFTNGWPGGYCSQFCTMSPDDCPMGSVCSPWLKGSQHPLCMQTCTLSSDCKPGYSCLSDGTHSICVF
jgi:hypothetical protein